LIRVGQYSVKRLEILNFFFQALNGSCLAPPELALGFSILELASLDFVAEYLSRLLESCATNLVPGYEHDAPLLDLLRAHIFV
jgi:hypothetical protein